MATNYVKGFIQDGSVVYEQPILESSFQLSSDNYRINITQENASQVLGGSIDSSTTEIETTISVVDQWEALAGTWVLSGEQHMDSPSNGQIRHLGIQPREFRIFSSLIVDGPSGNELSMRFRKWDNSESSFEDLPVTRREVNSLLGGRDVAYFNISEYVVLDQNDYMFLQIANGSGTGNVTVELDSFFMIEER